MPFEVRRDDIQKRVTVTIWGVLSTEQDLEILDRLRRENNIDGYGILYNVTAATGSPTFADARRFIGEELSIFGGIGRGPIAVLVRDPNIYRTACFYAALGRGKLNIQVFRDREEAEQWLASN